MANSFRILSTNSFVTYTQQSSDMLNQRNIALLNFRWIGELHNLSSLISTRAVTIYLDSIIDITAELIEVTHIFWSVLGHAISERSGSCDPLCDFTSRLRAPSLFLHSVMVARVGHHLQWKEAYGLIGRPSPAKSRALAQPEQAPYL